MKTGFNSDISDLNNALDPDTAPKKVNTKPQPPVQQRVSTNIVRLMAGRRINTDQSGEWRKAQARLAERIRVDGTVTPVRSLVVGYFTNDEMDDMVASRFTSHELTNNRTALNRRINGLQERLNEQADRRFRKEVQIELTTWQAASASLKDHSENPDDPVLRAEQEARHSVLGGLRRDDDGKIVPEHRGLWLPAKFDVDEVDPDSPDMYSIVVTLDDESGELVDGRSEFISLMAKEDLNTKGLTPCDEWVPQVEIFRADASLAGQTYTIPRYPLELPLNQPQVFRR